MVSLFQACFEVLLLLLLLLLEEYLVGRIGDVQRGVGVADLHVENAVGLLPEELADE